jgi:hypothetical protein
MEILLTPIAIIVIICYIVHFFNVNSIRKETEYNKALLEKILAELKKQNV